MLKSNYKTIREYKKYVSKKLEELTPIFLKISQGDFSAKIEFPEKEDEFTPLIVSLRIILDDLRKLDQENKEKTKKLEGVKTELEERVKERTKELQGKIDELEKFHRLAVGRELKMIKLKEKIKKLSEELEKLKG